MIIGVQWQREIPSHTIMLLPPHLKAYIRLSDTINCVAFASSLPYMDTSIITAKWKQDSSVNRTSAHCLCNHRWRCWVHYSRFCRLITAKLLPQNGRLECRPIDRIPSRTVDADRRQTIIPCICCAVCVAVRNRSRRWRNWMRGSSFADVILRLTVRSMSLTDPVSTIIWASLVIVEEEQPICLAIWRADNHAASIPFASWRWLLFSLGIFSIWNGLSFLLGSIHTIWVL
jgi:hypothetical protein